MRSLPLAGIAMVCSVCAPATTLVAVWSPEQLLLGADSSVTLETAALKTTGSACKIGQESSSFFAFSGLVDDGATNFHVESLAHEAVAGGGTLEDQLNRFVGLVEKPLASSVALVKRDSPAQFAFLEQGHPVLQAIFAFKGQGPATLAVAQFGVAPDGALAPMAKIIAQGDDGQGPRIIYAGQQAKIREYLNSHQDWYNGEKSDLVRNLIGLEIANSHGEVGGPVDIVKLTPNGARWLQRKTSCETPPTASASLSTGGAQ
jgi:hypothetical protein